MRSAFAVATLLSGLALADCAGCSEECTGANLGAEGCPCSTDQDCSTQPILMCESGSCQALPPDIVEGGEGCNSDEDCGPGTACGVDKICLPAPDCQRIDVALRFLLADDTEGPVTSSRDGCAHTWAADGAGTALAATITTIGNDGTMTLESDGENGCVTGRWFAAHRVGEVVCDGLSWAVFPEDAGVEPCFAAEDCGAGTCDIIGDNVGVCRS